MSYAPLNGKVRPAQLLESRDLLRTSRVSQSVSVAATATLNAVQLDSILEGRLVHTGATGAVTLGTNAEVLNALKVRGYAPYQPANVRVNPGANLVSFLVTGGTITAPSIGPNCISAIQIYYDSSDAVNVV